MSSSTENPSVSVDALLTVLSEDLDVDRKRLDEIVLKRTLISTDTAHKSADSHAQVPLKALTGGRPVSDMNVVELRRLMEEHASTEEKVIPFLLRFCLGEFHYGQRATPLLPGQHPAKETVEVAPSDDTSDTHAPLSNKHNSPSVVFEAFDVLASESRFNHLHQVAGWVDLDDKEVWDRYVRDVLDGCVQSGDRVFEAGCGVLAFLSAALAFMPDITIGGCDGAPRTVRLVKKELAPQQFKDNFFVGMLPDCLNGVADESWDVLICNSVFQYFASHDQALETVNEMLRVAKKWVIIADICSTKYKHLVEGAVRTMQWTKDLPQYRTYEKSWWDRFDDQGHLVSIRHVRVKEYARRQQRYVVYIEKNGRKKNTQC
ncbi:hypothetical protein FOZ61_008029 [Perkinsus olseni]|uniref:Methyltransferase type 12 domain-containing protein n=1 Tax=Perkinsus olseni TaxID=32597 RepID=A0A7J6M8Y5_PEROL|nr:hypothetical protein FOZ61_008029 [Perkinsus olseni]